MENSIYGYQIKFPVVSLIYRMNINFWNGYKVTPQKVKIIL